MGFMSGCGGTQPALPNNIEMAEIKHLTLASAAKPSPLRERFLALYVLDDTDAIVDACRKACTALIEEPDPM